MRACVRACARACALPAALEGGGVSLWLPADVQQPLARCPFPPTYWRYTYDTAVTVADSLLQNNSAGCAACSGGGLLLRAGGRLALVNTSVLYNRAGASGGGVAAGVSADLYPWGTSAPCGLAFLGGAVVANNTAGAGAAQLYLGCSGDVLLDDASVGMLSDGSQVRVPAPVCACAHVSTCARAKRVCRCARGLRQPLVWCSHGSHGLFPSLLWGLAALGGMPDPQVLVTRAGNVTVTPRAMVSCPAGTQRFGNSQSEYGNQSVSVSAPALCASGQLLVSSVLWLCEQPCPCGSYGAYNGSGCVPRPPGLCVGVCVRALCCCAVPLWCCAVPLWCCAVPYVAVLCPMLLRCALCCCAVPYVVMLRPMLLCCALYCCAVPYVVMLCPMLLCCALCCCAVRYVVVPCAMLLCRALEVGCVPGARTPSPWPGGVALQPGVLVARALLLCGVCVHL